MIKHSSTGLDDIGLERSMTNNDDDDDSVPSCSTDHRYDHCG